MSILKQEIKQYQTTLPKESIEVKKVGKFGLKLMSSTIAADYAALEEKLASQITWDFFPIPIFPGTLSTFVAPSGSGKTFFSTGMAISLALRGEKVLFLATEESINSFLKKTKLAGFGADHMIWGNLAHYYTDDLDREKVIDLYKEAGELGITYLLMDYAKPSVWGGSGELHTKLGDLFGSVLTAMDHTDITTFATIQGNRESRGTLHMVGGKKTYTPHPLELFEDNPEMVDIMIDGGLAAFRSSENVFFIHVQKGAIGESRHLVLCKAREFSELKGESFKYDVEESTLTLKLLSKDIEVLEKSVVKKKVGIKTPKRN